MKAGSEVDLPLWLARVLNTVQIVSIDVAGMPGFRRFERLCALSVRVVRLTSAASLQRVS